MLKVVEQTFFKEDLKNLLNIRDDLSSAKLQGV